MALTWEFGLRCFADRGGSLSALDSLISRMWQTGRAMRINHLARHRGVRTAVRLGALVGAIGVAALYGSPAASAAPPHSGARSSVVLAEETGAADDSGTEAAA